MDGKHLILANLDRQQDAGTILRHLHYESVVENDFRLQMILRSRTPLSDFEGIVKLDRKIAKLSKVNNEVKSHPIAIYLNKSYMKSKSSARMSKDLIYERMTPFKKEKTVKLGKLSNYF